MSKSVIYAGNNATQITTVAGSVVAFNNVVRRYGCNLGLSGGNVTLQGQGYYDVDVNITFTGISAGTLTVQVYKDGVAIPYANASVTTGADTINNLNIPCIVRECGCCDCSTITVVAGGVDVNITNAGIVVSKE